ncbi:MAG TPA: right-handed parallel beta-helix repeat-containing protein, partial [Chloroflexota bacterium]|nr:right-handed parallel beta-helix repeat-containing protein [Chloroflexota bacterium]
MKYGLGRLTLLAFLGGSILANAQLASPGAQAAVLQQTRSAPHSAVAPLGKQIASAVAPPAPHYRGHHAKAAAHPVHAALHAHRAQAQVTPPSSHPVAPRMVAAPALARRLTAGPRTVAAPLSPRRPALPGTAVQHVTLSAPLVVPLTPPAAVPAAPQQQVAAGPRVHPNVSGSTYVVPTAGCAGATGAMGEPSLGAALAAAQAGSDTGDTIYLCPSVSHYGVPSTTVGAKVTQTGLTIIGLGSQPSSVTVDASLNSGGGTQSGAIGIELTGLGETVQNVTVTNSTSIGVFITSGTSAQPDTLNTVAVTKNADGIEVGGGAYANLNKVNATANTQYGLYVSGGTANLTNTGPSSTQSTYNSNLNSPSNATAGVGAAVTAGGVLNADSTSFNFNYFGIVTPPGQTATITLTRCHVDNNRQAGLFLQGGGSLISGTAGTATSGTTYDNDNLFGLGTNPTSGSSSLSLVVNYGEANNNTGVVSGTRSYGYGAWVYTATATIKADFTNFEANSNNDGIVYDGGQTVNPVLTGLTDVLAEGNVTDGFLDADQGTVVIKGGTYGAGLNSLSTPVVGNGNDGIEIASRAFTSVTVGADGGGNGAAVNGNQHIGMAVDGIGAGSVTVNGACSFSTNGNQGIYINTGQSNAVTIGDGTHVVTVSGNGSAGSGSSSFDGIDLYTGGTNILTNVTADSNSAAGVYQAGNGTLMVNGGLYGESG